MSLRPESILYAAQALDYMDATDTGESIPLEFEDEAWGRLCRAAASLGVNVDTFVLALLVEQSRNW